MTAPPPSVARTGYQGFGSFFTEDIETIIRQPDENYKTPDVPFSRDSLLAGIGPAAELGAAIRGRFFIDFDRWTFINHGAFGAVNRPAMEEAGLWRSHAESNPLQYIDRELFYQLVRVTREVASFVGSRPSDLVLLPNATTGLNAVIKSVLRCPADTCYILDIGYGGVKKILEDAAEMTSTRVHVEPVPIPVPREDPEGFLLDLVARTLPEGAKLAVFDAVTSNTALVLPIKRLAALCRSRGVLCLIDGAHSLGMLDLDLEDLGADFFVANGHKWLCSPKGSALLHVRPEHQALIRPPVSSHGAGAGFFSRFLWDGCRDYSAILALSTSISFFKALGGLPRIRERNTALLREAAALLTAAWGTGKDGPFAPPSMTGFMALVELPKGTWALSMSDPAGSADAKYVQDLLHYEHAIECPVKPVAGRLYVRISVHIYNELADYQRLADAVLSISKRVEEEARKAAESGEVLVCTRGGGCG